ncbi:MAG: DUF177 domain-containing protein [Caldilineae bacterium]|nr:MAG: DUF177 domain-containing protein [Caldilineae bacterium]
MEFNVAQLLKEPIGAKRVYELCEDISELDADLAPEGPLTGAVELLRIHSGVLVTAEFNVVLLVECGRCLEPIAMPLSVRFQESFRPLTEVSTGRYIAPSEYEGQEEELEDAALLIDDHHILDIHEVVRQNIWLALPLVPGCVYEDPNRCPFFLERLREMQEAHADLEDESTDQVDIDPRWAALLNLHPEE